MTNRQLVSWLLKLALSTALLAALAYLVGWESIGRQLLAADLGLVFLGWGLGMARRVVDAAQMRLILRRVDLDVSLARVFFANAQSAFYGFLIPGDVASAAAKWANLAAATRSKSHVLNAMVYNRIMMLAPLTLAGTVAVALRNPWNSHALMYAGFAAALLLFATFCLLYLPRPGALLERALTRWSRGLLSPRLRQTCGSVVESLSAFRRFQPRQHVAILAISSVSACLGVLSFGLFSHAIGIVVPVLTLVWVRSALTLIRQLPISFHGVGVQEGSLLIMLGAYGIAAESAVGLGLLLFGNVLLFSLIGGLYQGALLLGWAKWTSADRSVDGDKRPIAP